MTNLLIKLFVKDPENIHAPAVRAKYGFLSSVVAICCNVLLSVFKFILGAFSHSIAITADAFNNLSDVGSGVVTLIGFRAASAPADEDHPFGHGRVEYISGLVITFLVFLVGFDVIKSAIGKIVSPEPLVVNVYVIAGLIASILLKLWMSAFNRKLGKKIESQTLKAAAQDSLNDCISTGATVVGIVLSGFLPFHIDGYLGLLVGGFILYAGYGLAKDTIGPLLGQKPDPELVRQIEEIVLGYDGIIGIHDLVLHDYGPGRVMGSAHVEVPRTMEVMAAHDNIDNAEKEIQRLLKMPFVLHYDPIANDDEDTNRMRETIANIVQNINEGMTIHDFRMVEGPTHTNLIFDLVVPPGVGEKNSEIKGKIDEALAGETLYYTVITFDRDFT